MGVSSLALFMLLVKKYSVYGAITIGITFFICLFLLDSAVLIRLDEKENHEFGFSLIAEFNRLQHISKARWIEMLSNVAVFVPFGFFLTEFLSETKRFSCRNRIRFVILIASGLSLCIECLQLILRIGVLEITDLVLNTMGAILGVGLSMLARKEFCIHN